MHPPEVFLASRHTERGNSIIQKYGFTFLKIAKRTHETLVATKDGKWYQWIHDTADKDFMFVGWKTGKDEQA